MNAQAGVGCYSWGPGTVTYVFMVDLGNSLNIYWKGESSQFFLTRSADGVDTTTRHSH